LRASKLVEEHLEVFGVFLKAFGSF